MACAERRHETGASPGKVRRLYLYLTTNAATGVAANGFLLPRDTLCRGFWQYGQSRKSSVVACSMEAV